jgi:hypothetical protein
MSITQYIGQKHIQKKAWYPHPGPQEEAFRYFYVDEIFYGGAKGGGKTDWLLFDFITPDLIKKPNYRGIIFRRTFPRLREIIDRSFLYFIGQADYNKQDRCWTWPSGAKLFFGHCQFEEDKYDYQGHEYHYVGFDQLEEFTESQYEFLRAQARSSDKDIIVRTRATGNPGNIGHLWVKRKFIDLREPMIVYKNEHGLTSMFIPAKVYDNPSLMDNDPMYVKRLQSLPEQDRRALLEGDWNIFAGQYFKEWDANRHVVEPYFIPSYWKRFIAGDYGMKKPASIGWYAIKPEGGIVRYREVYREGLHYDVLGKLLCELSEGETIDYAVFDPAVFGDKQHHKEAREGKSGAEIMQDEINTWFKEHNRDDKFGIVRGDNRRIEGWRAVKQMLHNEGEFEVFSNCVNFVSTFPANIHDEKNVEDLDTDGEDHSADECRYAKMSRPPKTDMTIKENINPNSAWGQHILKEKEKEKFIYG